MGSEAGDARTAARRVPPWWTPDLSDAIRKRESMPDVERLCSLYVRYHGEPQAVLARPNGWERASSQRNLEQLLDAGNGSAGGGQAAADVAQLLHTLQRPDTPHAVALKMLEAPAEFCVPVKQDRRLAPSFKVRVDVRVGSAGLELPVTVRAQLITQAQKDTLLSTLAEDGNRDGAPSEQDAGYRKFTELKGTSVLTATFRASPVLPTSADAGAGDNVGSNNPLPKLRSVDSSRLQSGAAAGSVEDLMLVGQGAHQGNSSTKNSLADALCISSPGTHATAAPGSAQPSHQPAGVADSQQPAVTRILSHTYDFPQLELLKPTRMNKVYIMFECVVMGVDRLLLVYHVPTIGICRAEQRPKAIQKLGVPYDLPGGDGGLMTHHLAAGPAASGLGGSAGASGNGVVKSGSGSGDGNAPGGDGRRWNTQVRPKRSAVKVEEETEAEYRSHPHPTAAPPVPGTGAGAVDAAPLLHDDGSVVVRGHLEYIGNVYQQQQYQQQPQHQQQQPQPQPQPPQGNNGYLISPHGDRVSALSITQPGATLTHLEPHPQGGVYGLGGQFAGVYTHAPSPQGVGMYMVTQGWQPAGSVVPSGAPTSGPMNGGVLEPSRFTRSAMAAMINADYAQAGFRRQLTHQDMQALLCQAGFPVGGDEGAYLGVQEPIISEAEWVDFAQQWALTLMLLREIRPIWDCVEPCIVSGFHMDRQGTVHALCREAVGTCVLRFSLSQPGSLVLTCKVYPGMEGADADGLLHVMLKIQDLMEQRLDLWILEFPGAVRVLDVYRQASVDKHVLFPGMTTTVTGPALTGMAGMLTLQDVAMPATAHMGVGTWLVHAAAPNMGL